MYRLVPWPPEEEVSTTPFFNEDVVEDNAYGSRPAELCLGSRSHAVRLETKFPLELLERRRRPERVHADHAARPADIAFPPERRGLLSAQPKAASSWTTTILPFAPFASITR